MRLVSCLLAGMVLGACQGSNTPDDRDNSPQPPTGLDWQSPVQVASGQAHQGPWRMNDSDFRYVDDPSVAMADDGSTRVAWADQARQEILLQAFDSRGRPMLDGPVNVSASPDTFSWLPRLVIADNGREIQVLWQEILFTGGSHGGEILHARSTDGGQTFSEPINLSRSPAGAGKGRLSRARWHNGSLDLARSGDGTLYAAWTEYEGGLRFSRSDDNGESFSSPRTVADDPDRPARGPSLAVAGDGTVYLAWTVGEDPGADIHLARLAPGEAEFDKPATIHPDSGHADAPKVAIDEDGQLHLTWARSEQGPAGDYQVVHSRKGPQGADFDPPVILSGEQAGAFPHLATAGKRVYVAWESFPEPGERPRGMSIVHSDDRGSNFSQPAPVPGSAGAELGNGGGRQGLLMRKLATDGNRRLAVVHSTYRSGQSSHIWLFSAQVAGNEPY